MLGACVSETVDAGLPTMIGSLPSTSICPPLRGMARFTGAGHGGGAVQVAWAAWRCTWRGVHACRCAIVSGAVRCGAVRCGAVRCGAWWAHLLDKIQPRHDRLVHLFFFIR